MLKIYEDIINEVISRLEESGDSVNINRSVIYELRNDWREKLGEYTQGEWVDDAVGGRDIYTHHFPYGGLRGRTHSFLSKETPMEKEPRFLEDKEDEHGSEVTSSDDLELIEDTTGNYMICLYVKVNKSKNKWKCVFKQGFINIGNIDFAFNSAQGELEW